MIHVRHRSRLLGSTLLAGTALMASPALAQTTPAVDPAAPAAEASGGDIVVTGTLIRNPNLISSSPVTSVGQEEISLRQTNTAEEVLRNLPGVVPSIGSAVNNGNGGSSFVDLRGLGDFRNVVLLDGSRIVPSSTVGRVDLNNVPLALVERVDVLTGGAATTYGADAVSGVINFITRKDFSGAEISATQQITEAGDGNVFRIDATLGANFDDGRGNAVLSIGYQEADPVYQSARRISENQYTSTTGAAGGSGTTVPGRFTVGSTFNQINPTTGGLQTPVVPFNFAPFNLFQTPFKRFNMFGAANYEVSDSVELYTRGLFSKNTVNTVVAPSGLFSSVVVVPVSSPFLPVAARNTFCANNDFDFATPGVQTLTPAQCTAAAAATSATDPNFRAFTTTVGRRTPELGTRNSEYVTQIFDYRAGVRLGITDAIKLDVSGAYGESENRQTLDGYLLTSRARTAIYTSSATTCNLGASPTVPNPNPLLPPLATSGASPSTGAGCVPLNIFGPNGSISAGSIPYLTATATNANKSSLAQARALLSGDFGASSPWADDPIGFAVGAEYRHYEASQSADSLSQTAGELGGAGGAVSIFSGGYEVYEAYGELIAPIAQDKPFFKSLTVEGGIRYSSYTVQAAGRPKYDTTTYKAGGTWEPVDGLKFRGNYQRAVRAPNINELFAPTVVGLTNLAQDPCRTSRDANGVITRAGPLADANLASICRAQGAPAASIGFINNPTAAQANGTFAGGLYLRPETSDSYTFGVVLQPTFLPGLSVAVDYYNIRIKNAISQPTVGSLVSGCFGTVTATSATSAACALFRRNPVTGGLDGDPATTGGLVFPASNSGRIETDGIDVNVNYRHDFNFVKLALNFNGNWTRKSTFTAIVPGSTVPVGFPGAGGPFNPSGTISCVGLYGQNCGSPGSAGPNSAPGSLQPEFTWNTRTTLTFGDIDVSMLWRHIDSMRVEPGITTFSGTLSSGALAGQTVNFGRIKAYDYFDLATRFGISDNFDLTLTVQNLLNRQPPVVGSTVGSTSFNSGNTYPSTYDTLGRRFAIGARLKF